MLSPCDTLGRVTLLTELDAFFTNHRLCGGVEAGVDADMVWIACDCGASMARRVDDDGPDPCTGPRPW
jgi:hypothetical protein